MVRSDYLSFLEKIDEPNRSAAIRLYDDNVDLFDNARGSKTKHQAWRGGYLDHLVQGMDVGSTMYALFRETEKFPFTLSDFLLVFSLHDVEKPWKQTEQTLQLENASGVKDDMKIKDFKHHIIEKYGFVLTKDHLNALKYAEGEGTDYDPHRRVMGPLAAFVHAVDTLSARLWFDSSRNTRNLIKPKALVFTCANKSYLK